VSSIPIVIVCGDGGVDDAPSVLIQFPLLFLDNWSCSDLREEVLHLADSRPPRVLAILRSGEFDVRL